MGVIYKVTCNINGNFLIGSTSNFKVRKNSYYNKLKNNKWTNPYLQNCYNKYGKDSIIIDIIEDNIPKEKLLEKEDLWIISTKSFVDLRLGGMNMRNASTFNPSVEVREKQRKAAKNQFKILGHPMKGKKHSVETKQKLKEATLRQLKEKGHPRKGIKLSEETKNKIRESLLARSKS